MAIPIDEARAVVLEFVRDYPGALALGFQVRATIADLYGPVAAKAAAEALRGMKGAYFPSPTPMNEGDVRLGRVDLPLENISDAGDLLLTLRHEVLGHFGINTFTSAEKRALLDGLIYAREQPGLSLLWQTVDRLYEAEPLDRRAEEVFALYCEGIRPSHHVGNDAIPSRGHQAFVETCIARVRPMQLADLYDVACLTAQGLHDRTRTQQNFPQITVQFRKDSDMEPKKPYHELVAEKLIEQLRAGTAPWQIPWAPGNPNMFLPMNPSTGKRYRGINAVYLTAQGRRDSRWLTYKQAAGLGAQVRKGERGTPIQYWKFVDEREKLDANGRPVLDADGKPLKETVALERPRVFTAVVFNAEQIDGMPPLERKEQTWAAVDRAEHILAASQADITHAPGNRAFYRPSSDSITLPERTQFPSAAAYYATAMHELGHWTGHPSRLDRDLVHPFGSAGYAREELRAEIASMIVGDELGIGHDPGQHAAYVAHWIQALQDDPLEIFRAAADAEKIQGYVLAFEQKQVQEQEQAKVQQPEQHYSDLTLRALVEKHGWEVAYTGLREPGRVDSVQRTFEGVGPLGTMVTPNGERRLSAGYHDDAEHRRHVTLKLGGQVIGDADGHGQDAEEVARQINARAEQYADERRVKNGLEPIYSIALQQAQAQQLSDVQHGDPHHQEQDQETKMQAPEQTEAWLLKHVELGTVGRALEGASLEQIDRALDLLDRMQPLNTRNAFWTRHELPHDLAPLEAKINDAIDHLDEERRPDAVVAATRLDLATGNTSSRERDRQAFHQASVDALGFPLPYDWTGEVWVVGVVEREGGTRAADLATETPEAYHLYARKGQFGEDPFEYLTATRTLGEADELTDRLALIDANSQTDAYEKATRLARVQEDRVRRDPNSTDEDISAAKEDRKALEAKAFVAAEEAKNAQRADDEQRVATASGTHPVPSAWQGEACRQFDEQMTHRMGGQYDKAQELFSRVESAKDRIEDIHWDGRTPSAAEAQEERELQAGIDEAESWLHENVYLNPIIKERMYPVVQNRSINLTDDIVAYLGEMKARLGTEAGLLRDEGDAQQKPVAKAAERKYLSVPFKDKDEAKGLGARWDRQQQSWYVPAGVEAGPFAKWVGKASQTAAEAANGPSEGRPSAADQNAARKRVYLAVPYADRVAAKAAGAAWDKVARSWYAAPGADLAKLQRWLGDTAKPQQDPAITPREEFAEALRSLGCVVSNEHPIMDGKTHRIGVDGDKQGERAGFYVGHLDGHPAGYVRNNRTGAELRWKSKGYVLDETEKARLQAEAATKLAERAAEQERTQEASAERVSQQLNSLVPMTVPTPYLQKKGVRVHAGVYTDRDAQKTYIPAIDVHGKQWTMQYIQEDGTKRFAKNSRKEGCFHPVGGLAAIAAAPVLIVAEGYATAATLAEAVGHGTVAAFDSGNLAEVARALHAKYPDKPVIIAGDDDRPLELTHGVNAGRAKAEEAAQAVGGTAIHPIFAPGEASYPSDLPAITPQAYREHDRAAARLAAAKEDPERVRLTAKEVGELQRSLLTDQQLAALAKMKSHTDFNDLAANSALGLEGVRRQVSAAVGHVLSHVSRETSVVLDQGQRAGRSQGRSRAVG